jgi:hypothetical protein
MDVAEASLIVVSVWVTSLFFALVLGHWLEMAKGDAGGLGDVAGAQPVTIGATKPPMRTISRRARWAPAGAASTRTVQRFRRCQRRP